MLFVALLLPSVASAARGHQFKETFGTPCTELVCGPGELKEPSAVAVNEATGEVYVLDQGNNRIEIFAGEPPVVVGEIKEFEVEPVAEPGVQTTFSFGAAPQVSGIAVDNSCSLEGLVGAACEDPSNEDVYVVDPGHNVVDKFKPDGEYLGQITEAHSEPLKGLGGVALDPAGVLWLYQEREVLIGHENGAFYKFSNAPVNTFMEEVTIAGGRGGFGFFAPGFAVDRAGSFYAGVQSGGLKVEKYAASGERLIPELDSENSTGIAVDLRSEVAFLDNLTTVVALSTDGSLPIELERLGNEAGTGHLAAGAGLAADAASETIYVADSGAGQVVVFGPQEPKAPEIVAEGVQNISSTAATPEAEINPRSEIGDTSYRFQYGPCAGALPTCAASAFPFETAAGQLAPDFEIHQVAALITGLQPGTPYHFRLFAENGQGETTGPEETFTTQSVGGSLLLPDSRQWQLVSPPDKLGALIAPISQVGVVQAATDGRAITYLSNAATEAQPQGVGPSGVLQVLSTRAPDGWLSQDINPPHDAATGAATGEGAEYRAFSADLSFGFVDPFGPFTPSISPEASEQSVFRRTNYLNGEPGRQCLSTAMSCYTPLVTGVAGVGNVLSGAIFGDQCAGTVICGPRFVDADPGGDHAVFGSRVPLTGTPIPGPSQSEALYEWDAAAPPDRQLRFVSLLPGGTEGVENPKLGYRTRSMRNAISDDGSRIVFSEGSGPSNSETAGGLVSKRLFLRDVPRERTVQLDTGDGCVECESGAGRFQLASADGSRVLFTDIRPLTDDSGAKETAVNSGKADLYECQIVEDVAGEPECDLTDLTPETQTGESVDVLGSVIGASEDASTAYFVANGDLTPAPDSQGEQAVRGDCRLAPQVGEQAKEYLRRCNLYVIHDAHVDLVSVLSGQDFHDWAENLAQMPARVSADGRWLAFMSQRSLTGSDNRDLVTTEPAAEVYLFDATTGRLACASCDPTGGRPHGVEYDKLEPAHGGLVGGPAVIWRTAALVAANVPGWTADEELGAVTRHQPRYLSNSGRLFFNTVNALVPQDANGTQDVYEYEPSNIGSCTTQSQTFGELSEGCVSLISSGTSAQESAFLDASENGDDVFFLTSARLSGLDTDSARDVYDAHVCTAEVPCLPEPQPPAPACSGDACQQPATAPNDATPGSLTFNGAGNLVQCPKGKQLKKGKCVKKAQKKVKKHKKKHHKKGKGKKSHKAKK
jgi:hypothetical protein